MLKYQKNQLLQNGDSIIRVLAIESNVLIVDCLKRTMPRWVSTENLQNFEPCDESVLSEYPQFHRFKYFYQKTRKIQTALISREGKTSYQRDCRPLLGTISDFTSAVGTAMLDSTILDIYLINTSGQVVGRPILTLSVDAYSSLICGYHLSWERGVYSLQKLMHVGTWH